MWLSTGTPSVGSNFVPHFMVDVLLVDSRPIVQEGYRAALDTYADIEVVDCASSRANAVEKVDNRLFDVAVVCIQPFSRNVTEGLDRLRVTYSDTPVLILGSHPAGSFGKQVIQAGAAGYVQTQSSMDRLAAAIRTVAGGDLFITPAVATALSTSFRTDAEPGPSVLSKREFQVLYCIANGHSRDEIAGKLGVSPKTVSTYRSRILCKLGLNNDVEITHYAILHDIVGLLDV